jgi:coenzyme Q-binding protein COQ10
MLRRKGLTTTLLRAAVPWRRQLFALGSPQRRQVALTDAICHPREEVFSVVADVRRYAEFLPFCTASEIVTQQSEDTFDARLCLGFLAFTEDYVSRVKLSPHHTITATASNTPLFSHLVTEWRFEEGSCPDECRLHFRLDLLLRSALRDQALHRVLDRVAKEQVAAFKQRCDALLGRKRAMVAPPGGVRPADGRGSRAACRRPLSTFDSAPRHAPYTPWTALRSDPEWRRRVDAAFDAHAAATGFLTLPRFVEACRALGVHPDAPLSPDDGLQQTLLAAWFVQFDEDASGRVGREEFMRNLFMLTRASDEERMAYVFHRLDVNRSGALERGDLSASMRQQLELARRLVPIIVQQQVRKGSAIGAGYGCNALTLREEASAVAAAAIDDLDAQVEQQVEQVFASLGVHEQISFGAWSAAWARTQAGGTKQGHACPTGRLSGIDAVLGMIAGVECFVEPAIHNLGRGHGDSRVRPRHLID